MFYLHDKEYGIMEATLDTEVTVARNDLVSVMLEYDSNMKLSEQKVFIESASNEDLEMLYTEAKEEASNKAGGIISSIVRSITNFFKNITDAVTGKVTKHEAELSKAKGNITIEGDPSQVSSGAESLISKGKALVQKLINGYNAKDDEIESYIKATDQFARATTATIAAGGAIAAIKKMMNSKKKVETAIEVYDANGVKVKDPSKLQAIQKVFGGITKVSKKLGGTIMDVTKKLTSLVKAGKQGAADGEIINDNGKQPESNDKSQKTLPNKDAKGLPMKESAEDEDFDSTINAILENC